MKKIFLSLLCLFALTQTAFAQKNRIFKDLILSDSLTVIGMYPQYDKQKVYEKYNFIIRDIAVIKDLVDKLTYGKKVANGGVLDAHGFSISVFKNHKHIASWSIMPRLSMINIDGNMYEFNIKVLEELAQKHPFKYDFETKIFNSKIEFEQYKKEVYTKDIFLFMYEPSFRYEGKFDVEYAKSDKFPHPKGISEYLEELLGKRTDKNDYSVYYAPSSKYNKGSNNRFYSMTIDCNKDLYDRFQDKNCKKREWIPVVIDAMIFFERK